MKKMTWAERVRKSNMTDKKELKRSQKIIIRFAKAGKYDELFDWLKKYMEM